ncbi:helix-turn-helix transcriptional regulator [Sphingomonas ginsenosidivorax]|uniref:Helix-turn-helix transcriptional regulator n=1 Tax=Sphingomonas ginsenosidivorax TaxID=862135 RepID=A0A5C6UI97_9SPHN|nr:helix-turn-helix transcriptional regulator [Sphingomonas ginsenosidivorax]TXC72180.1 helix-turn-helix transcriptional regulator [Sphingomonas ginsenosidivorax]
MITAIREVRRAKGMTLDAVARACVPPTTAQTVGRLETGTRTVSVGWLNRIADALGVTAADLVTLPDRADLPVAALLDADGVRAPRRATAAIPPQPMPGQIAVTVTGSTGDYRSGDEIWCEPLGAEAFADARNRDVLVPRPAGRFVFGRLIDLDGTAVTIAPPGSGSVPQTIIDPAWIGRAVRLVRTL